VKEPVSASSGGFSVGVDKVAKPLSTAVGG